MGIYNKYVLPKVINSVCQGKPTMRQRAKVVPLAEGNVLEIGIGSGLNLPFYNVAKVKKLTGIDPSEELWKQNKTTISSLGFDFNFIKAVAENIPIKSQLFDTVVITYTLCTVNNTKLALNEIKRVLKPNGKLIFSEHGIAPDTKIQKWQHLINPFWKKVGGGCNLNRDMPSILESNGFKIRQLETMYLPGWKPASYNYWGFATIKH